MTQNNGGAIALLDKGMTDTKVGATANNHRQHLTQIQRPIPEFKPNPSTYLTIINASSKRARVRKMHHHDIEF